MKTVYLGLDSNIGDRRAILEQAVARLDQAGVTVCRVSSIYETEPVGYAHQPWFLNIVVEASTHLMPMQLLAKTTGIEQALGKKRIIVNGPRTIDIDILLYGRTVIDSPSLIVPHPRMHERRFVLDPFAELRPNLRHPVLGKTIASLRKSAHPQATKFYSKWKEPAVAGS